MISTPAVQDVREKREAPGAQDPIDDFEATAPGRAGDRAPGPVPGPRLGRLPLTEVLQRSRVGPVESDVLGFAGIGDVEGLPGQ